MGFSISIFLLALLCVGILLIFTVLELNKFENKVQSFTGLLKTRYNMEDELKQKLETQFSDLKPEAES